MQHDGFELEHTSKGWTVTGYAGDAAELAIPPQIDGESVVLVAVRAFEGNRNLVSLEIPDTVTFVGNYACSNCSSLQRVILPDSLSTLNLGLFWNCTALVDVKLPQTLENLGDGVFRDCTALRSLDVPRSVTRIGDRAFSGCTALESIVLDGAIQTIERSAFRDCTALSTLIVSSSLAYIGPRAFQGCPQLTQATILGSNIGNTLGAFRNHGLTYLVADYAIEHKLVTFDEAKKLLNAKEEGDLVFGARVATSFPERLQEIVSKQKMARILAGHGCTKELTVLAEHPGFLTEASLPACIDAASQAGHTETAAFLLDMLAKQEGGNASSSPLDSLKL